jgi:hypothetical protein
MEKKVMIPKRLLLYHSHLTVGVVLAIFEFKVGLVLSRNVLVVQGVGRTHIVAEGLPGLGSG